MTLRRMSQSAVTMALVLGMVVTGFLIGFIDIHNARTPGEVESYILACAILGFARPKLLWLWPMLFAVTLYMVHLWAIRHGYQPPYVEKNEEYASVCLLKVFPALAGGLVGGGLYVCRSAWRAIKESDRKQA